MKKTIYKYIFSEFVRYFSITLFALAVIVWTIQAVNYLDLVLEDGHAFAIYFLYSFLTISKVLTKLIPFSFLIATMMTILKFEKDNELMVLWTSGLNKIHIVNLFFRISLLVMLLQLIFTNLINPTMLNYSRTVIKNSELQFIPSLLKEKQFNDTVEDLTIFVSEKDENGIYKDIFIRDDGKILAGVGGAANKKISSTILAKSGYISESEKNLILLDGSIQRLEGDENLNIFNFDKINLNLLGISTKSISLPKIQETSTQKILLCLKTKNINILNCNLDKKSLMDLKIEFNKRFGMPIYIPLIALICSFLLISRKDSKIHIYKKYVYFVIGFVILIAAEIIVRYSGISWTHTGIYYLLPFLISPSVYMLLNRTFKYENLS